MASNKNLPHAHGELSNILFLENLKEDTFEMVSNLFKLMSDNKRIYLFWILCHCEQCVINLSYLLNIPSSTVSHHLKILKSSGLVISRREGKEVYYTIAKTPHSQSLHEIIEQIIEVSCETSFNSHRLYDSNIHTIDEVHSFITTNLSSRFSIEFLAKKFHINQTTLKETFKMVYGKPIAKYVKEYKIRYAEKLLIETDKKISLIANELGYDNQSKFSKAFYDVLGTLPKDYRKINRF